MKEEFSFDEARLVVTLGRGKSGILVQGYLNKRNYKIYAIKTISVNHQNYLKVIERFHQECNCLTHLQSERSDKDRDVEKYDNDKLLFYRSHIVNCLGLVENVASAIPPNLNPKPVYLCLEACLGGNLYQHLHHNLDESFRFTLYQCRVYVTQLVNALLFLHCKKVIHRDLKLSNIMLNSFGHIKIIDFDCSKLLTANESERTFTLVGTFHLLSPELLICADSEFITNERFEGYDYSVDWWSLGHLVYELLMKDFIPLRWKDSVSPSGSEDASKISSVRVSREYLQNLLKGIRVDKDDFSEVNIEADWGYRSVSRFQSLIDTCQRYRSGKVRDFTTFIPSSYELEPDAVEILRDADNLIEQLLKINPQRRLLYRNFREGIQRENTFEDLRHPFFIQRLSYLSDLTSISSIEEYNQLLIQSYSFPINEKIGFYEMFPQQNEALLLRKSVRQSEEKDINNSDEITDEQQQLFKDF